MVLGEVINHPGRWSSYPPHSHAHPEIYHYRFHPEQGFGFSQTGDEVYRVTHRDTVTISGEKKRTELDRPSKVHRLERSFGQFQRTLQFPTAVDFDAAEATFESGLLHLTIPKSAQAVPRKIQIRTEKNPPEA